MEEWVACERNARIFKDYSSKSARGHVMTVFCHNAALEPAPELMNIEWVGRDILHGG